MRHHHPEISYATINGARENDPPHDQSSQLTAQFLFKLTSFFLIVVLMELISSVLGNAANAASRTTILNYICSTYESARQVALDQSWERPESMPANCSTLYQRRFELRVAEVQQIIEVLPIRDGLWIEVGRVRGSMLSGYSAGIVVELLLY